MALAAERDALEGVPVVKWPDFETRFRWEQGEHVSAIGPTGTGKTTLLVRLSERRKYVCMLGSKPKDRLLSGLERDGWRRTKTWPPAWPTLGRQRVLLWPEWRSLLDVGPNAQTYAEALEQMFLAGGWCIAADELAFLCEDLKLTAPLRRIWTQGRSMEVSLLGATQRPAWVPRHLYSAATHVFLWRTRDQDDLRSIGGLGGIDPKLVRRIVAGLPRHAFLYANTRTDDLVISRVL